MRARVCPCPYMCVSVFAFVCVLFVCERACMCLYVTIYIYKIRKTIVHFKH